MSFRGIEESINVRSSSVSVTNGYQQKKSLSFRGIEESMKQRYFLRQHDKLNINDLKINKMKKLYTILSFLLLSLSLYSQKQIDLTLIGSDVEKNISLYSYYPLSKGNPPVSVEKTDNNGKAILSITESLPKGIYSLYASENGNMNNAQWLEIYIDTSNKQVLNVTWDLNAGKQSFENSGDNKEFSIYRDQYAKLQRNLHQAEDFQRSFEYSSPALRKTLSEIKGQLERSTDSLLDTTNIKDKNIWQRYIPLVHRYSTDLPSLEKFWDDFPKDDDGIFHSPAIQTAQYQYHSLLSGKYENQEQIDSIAISTIFRKFSSTRSGFAYFRDWLHAWFDNNGTQKQYLQGIKLLSEASAAIPEERSQYRKEWEDIYSLQTGKAFPVNILTNGSSRFELDEQKTDMLSLVFFSADCHFCVEELERLNAYNDKQNIIAVNVNKEDKVEDKGFTSKYPNIRFVYPADPAAIKGKFAFRGTPTEYDLVKKNGEWIISDMR